MSSEVTRRVFVHGLGFVGMGLVLATLGGCESLFKSIRERPVRRWLRSGSPEVDAALAIYRDAVAAMKALPSSDPRSWHAQTALHGTATGFTYCQHGTNHFFSWHRAYLAYFEQICQQLTGEKKFGLPYWNWNQNPAILAAFTDSTSSLFNARSNTTVGTNFAFQDATLDTIFTDTNFFSFGSQIEGAPHNMAHGIVGGDMANYDSPLDPVFWTHHCMVDYCWAKWNLEMANDNPNDPAWTDPSWSHFVDRNGDPATMTAGLTTIMPLLTYRYESSAIGSHPAEPEADSATLATLEKRVRTGADVRFEIKKRVPVAERASMRVAKPFSTATTLSASDLASLVESDRATERVFLSVDYASLPATNDFFVRVFLALPNAQPQTPTSDPHYAGSFAFFGTSAGGHGGHHHPKTNFLVDVTETLKRLRASGELRAGAKISVQLVAVPFGARLAKPSAELVVERLDFIVTPVHVRSQPK